MTETQSHKRSFIVLFLVVATELIGFGLIIPVLPQIGVRMSLSAWQLGSLLAAYSAAQFISAPILGKLSDIYGRKPLLIWSKLGTVIAYIIFAYSTHFWMILAARLVDGFTGGNIAVARAYVADITSEENRSRGMALIGIAFGVGFLFGPALGGVLFSGDGSFFIPGLTASALSCLALLLTVFLLKEPEARKESRTGIQHLFRMKWGTLPKVIFGILGIQLVYMVCFSGFESTLSIFTFTEFNFNEAQNSWLFVFAGISTLLIQGTLARKAFLSEVGMVKVGCGLLGLSFIGLSFTHSVASLLVSLAILAFGVNILNVNMPSLMSVKSDSNSQGAYMGMYEAIGSFSRILGPLIAIQFVYFGLQTGYLIFGFVLWVVVGLIWLGFRTA